MTKTYKMTYNELMTAQSTLRKGTRRFNEVRAEIVYRAKVAKLLTRGKC